MSRFYEDIDDLIKVIIPIENYINENFIYDMYKVKIVKDWNPKKSKFEFRIKIKEMKSKKVRT